MRSQLSPVDMLITTAKKKPHLQTLVDKALSMSDAEIESLQEKPWIKNALKKIRKQGDISKQIEFVLKNAEFFDTKGDPNPYEVRTYHGPSIWISNGKTEMQLNEKTAVCILEPGKIQYDNLVCTVKNWDSFMRYSITVREMTIEDYRRYYRHTIMGRNGPIASPVELENITNEPRWGTNKAGIRELRWTK